MNEQVSTPVIRALLLTDLCDSVALVERIGDVATAGLFRSHDLLVLELQQRWSGRLIDRSDGMLLVFERPLHAIGFALDYMTGLDELGRARQLTLKARAGLHVGEVLLWENSQQAIDIGAKPLEVEGLAKPMAARLMTMARPGQVLVSPVAEALARRALRDDDEGLGDRLVWKSHGRWRLKGVPTAQEIYEVGTIDLAPLRMPLSSGKAWRDLPLWRRPLALVVQALAIVGVVAGSWITTRSEPALAFAERDWVVLADIRNTTNDRLLDDSLEQALRLSMEQSPYVNLLSSLKVGDSLERMRRPADARLDRDLAAEIALRDGARAVIVPVLAEVGGILRLSAEVIDPLSRNVVYVESVDSNDKASLLHAVDELSSLLRGRLGEAVASIDKNSSNLPGVATDNLDALRAYALAEAAFGRGDYRNALGLYDQALELDKDFALALLGKVRAMNATEQLGDIASVMARIDALSSRIPARELMYYRAWKVQIEEPDKAYARWSQMAQIYPDFHQAFANAGYAMEAENRFREGIPYIRRASEARYEFSSLSQESWARMAIGNGSLDEAAVALERAAAGGVSSVAVWQSNLAAVRRDFTKAEAAWPGQSALSTQFFDRSSQLLDQGLWSEAVAEMEVLLGHAVPGSARSRQARLQLAVARRMAGQSMQARNDAAALTAESLKIAQEQQGMTARAELAVASYASLLAHELGDSGPMRAVLSGMDSQSSVLRLQPAAGSYSLLRIQQLIDNRQWQQAGKALHQLEGQHHSLLLLRMQMLVANGQGDVDKAVAHARRISLQRGQAYAEFGGCGWCVQGYNVVMSNRAALEASEILAASGDVAGARAELMALEANWPPARLPDHLRRRRDAVLSTFN